MKFPKAKTETPKSFLVQILQWFYLLVAILAVILAISSTKLDFITHLGFPKEIFIGFGLAIAVYALILSVSFFTQNSTLLILSLVLIFFTTIGALIMLAISIPNSHSFLSGQLPACSKNLSLCSLKDGIAVSSAILFVFSIPTLILNIVTIVGAVKAIAARD